MSRHAGPGAVNWLLMLIRRQLKHMALVSRFGALIVWRSIRRFSGTTATSSHAFGGTGPTGEINIIPIAFLPTSLLIHFIVALHVLPFVAFLATGDCQSVILQSS